jgi:hypothetical protein
MSTITVPKPDLTLEEVARVLREGLGSKYNVQLGMGMSRHAFGSPLPDRPDTILVGTGSNRVIKAEVGIIRRGGLTQLDVRPGGISWDLIINSAGIARKVRHVLESSLGHQ